MLGVSTIGNATLIAYDGTPILATDPWFGDEDRAYFGSWTLNHKIPDQCKKDILAARYIWFSHGHQDHLNPDSLKRFAGKKLLLPDHVGGRVLQDFKGMGFEAEVLPDRQWVRLTPNIQILCITTVIQDAVLLVDVNGHLFINLNDAGLRHNASFIRNIVKNYEHSYVMVLSGYGDADMINFYDESGKFVAPPAAKKPSVGKHLSLIAHTLGAKAAIPFSSFHAFQRTDSVWAQQFSTDIPAYREGFDESLRFVDAFSHIDCVTGDSYPLNPEPIGKDIRTPEEFGDNWSDVLEAADVKLIEAYFKKNQTVSDFLSFLNFRVGGKDNIIKLSGKKDKGITFEAPRGSLMSTIQYEVFDDLLATHFMKATLHNLSGLYEGDFNFYLAKYGDNGRAHTYEELEAYFKEYRRRAGREWIYDNFLTVSKNLLKRVLPRDSRAFNYAKTQYYLLK